MSRFSCLRKSLRPGVATTAAVGLVCLAFFCMVAAAQSTGSNLPYDSVDPIIGTSGDGNTFPGATLPFGMIQWSPDTGPNAWYYHSDHRIYGFSLTHISGAGCPVYGDFPVLPWPGGLTVSPHQNRALYTQAFDHSHEEAHPGYYAITLASGIRVEITVMERAGIARFIFPAGTPARLLLNAGGSANSSAVDKNPDDPARANDGYRIRIDGKDSVSGQARAGGFCGSPTRYEVYMAAQFSKPFVRTAMWRDDTVDPAAREENAHHAGALLDFGDVREVDMRVGLSFVSVQAARGNMKLELLGRNFDQVHDNARRIWSDLLGRIDVEGGTPEQRTTFYTGLYHMLLSPNVFSDENGDYTGFDDKVHKAEFRGSKCAGMCTGAQYANFSEWDIYRDVVQFQALLDPDRASDMAQSLIRNADQSGWLARWPYANDNPYVMGGDSAAIVLADEYAFGARGFDARSGLAHMIKGATQLGNGLHGQAERLYLADELRLGYVANDHDTLSASRTLEFASDDFAVAQLAHSLDDTADYEAFMKRAGNWQNLFDPDSKWIRPRNSDGSWQAGFDALHSLPKVPNAQPWVGPLGFEEGNSPQYSFMIPFGYARLISAMGGDKVVDARLDSFFSKLICWGEPCFNMANEPDFVVPYLYEYTGQPWKTDDVITRIEQQTFGTGPNGIPGNDDLGATSGVYVWNALGLYPGVPGVGGFFIGTPMFPKATVHFGDGRTVVVERRGEGVYVNAVARDGQPWNSYWLPLDQGPAHATTTLQYTLQDAAPASITLQPPPAFIPAH